MKQHTILVAGASGYLGSRLVKRFLAEGHTVIAGVRTSSRLARLGSLKDRVPKLYLDASMDAISESLREFHVDTVVNCITDYGRSSRSEMRVLQANLVVPHQLLLASIEAKVNAYINSNTSMPPTVNSYALAKNQFRHWLANSDRMPRRIDLAIEQFYGPDEDADRLVPWLIEQFTGQTQQLELTAGEQKRDFVYIDDVVNAFSLIVERQESLPTGFHDLSVGCGTTCSIREFIELIQRLCGNQTTQLIFGALPYVANELMFSCSNNARIVELGWMPSMPLQAGLMACIDSHQIARLAA